MLGALENAIRTRGYYTLLCAAQSAAEIHRVAQTWNALGLVVMGLQAGQCRELMQVTQKPIVFIDCYFEQGEQYNNIGLADREGMRGLTRHLLSLGHRDILYVGDLPTLEGLDAERLAGHIEALREAGIKWSKERYLCISKDRKRRPEDYDRLIARLRRGQDTAWMFISDYYAVEAMGYLYDHGVRVPGDISVTGFDDNILARVVRPRLTTVHQSVPKKADWAVKTLFEVIEGELEAPFSLTLPTRLVKGQSVRALNGTDGE
jgi:LacI family transcriptional regulator